MTTTTTTTATSATAKETEAAVRFEAVSKWFGQGETRHRVLDEATFDVPAGKTTVIAGGSGQGKSVTLKLILGLMRPDAGRVVVFGQEPAKLGVTALRALRTRYGVLFQGSALFDSLNVFENIALPLRERTQMPEEAIRARVDATLNQLNLKGHENKYPAQLSGGMQKRVGLARALQLDPELVLFDEPTTGLDPVMTKDIHDLFAATQRRLGYTAVIVSHDVPQVFELADRIVLINRGELEVFDSVDGIVHAEKPAIREFTRIVMGPGFFAQEQNRS